VIDPLWNIEDPESDEALAGGPQPILVSLHFLRAALRRRWRLWAAFAIVGMALGLAVNFGVPAKSSGTVTLLLAHDPQSDPSLGMATDVSLLSTRTVAVSVIKQLDLQMSPERFLESFTATAVTPQVLVLKVSAPSDSAAVARAGALANEFLMFRTAQMEVQSSALIDGYNKRIAELQRHVDGLTKQYNVLSGNGPAGQSQAADVLTQRAQIVAEVNTLQQTVEDAALRTTSIVDASHILDPASAVPSSVKKRALLDVGSGLIGGMAVGIGLVLFLALTSDRLRRREEVAMALGAPVRLSVRTLLPRRQPWRRLSRRGRSAAGDLEVIVHALESGIWPYGARPARLAIAAIDDVANTGLVAASLAVQLTGRGLAVFLVDLSDSGLLDRAVTDVLEHANGRPIDASATPVVFRPEGVPSLAQGPVGVPLGEISDLAADHPRRPAWDAADVVLTLADLDPAVGVEHLTSWADQVVILVTAGRSSAERLRTTAKLIRSAGLRLLFAVLVGADRTDESLGLPETAGGGPAATWRTTTQ
jgi:capsular polysaccharide biosynthesis protein